MELVVQFFVLLLLLGLVARGSPYQLQATLSVSSSSLGLPVLSADGSVLATSLNTTRPVLGAAIFVRNAKNYWSEVGVIKVTMPWSSTLGVFIGISGDGSTIVFTGSNLGQGGAIAVFYRSNSSVNSWSQQGSVLQISDSIGKAQFGISVSVSTAGNRILVGGNGDNSGVGAVWIFHRSNGVWSEEKKLTGTTSNYGFCSEISGDGNTVFVTEEYDITDDTTEEISMKVQGFLYTYTNGAWNLNTTLLPTEAIPNNVVGNCGTISGRNDCNVGL